MSKSKPMDIEATIQKAIRDSGLTYYAIAKASDGLVTYSQLHRFMDDDPDKHRSLSLKSASAVCNILGLKLVKV